MFSNKSILVTGGTGSFGVGFVKKILDSYHPKSVIIFSRDELKQYEMQQQYCAPHVRYYLGDVRDKERVMQVARGVDFIVHAAAQKQVVSAEHNPLECIKTNIHGAENVIQAAIENKVEKVISLSTDKAVSPVNLYGATKLCSDKLFIAANNLSGNSRTEFSIVRYGNVVGSRGSVLPIVKKIIASGEEYLPITDARMTRFWITLQQGVDFVVKSFARMQGGEIFVPKISSVKITALMHSIAPEKPVKIIGIRPGEKLHEVLCTKDESHLTLEFKDHFVIRPAIKFHDANKNYQVNSLEEKGEPVEEGFEYSSEMNPDFLDEESLAKYS